MNLAELLTAIEALAPDRELPICLASRTVGGQRIDNVQVRTVGGISVDEESEELILLSAAWVGADEIGSITTINEFCTWAIGTQGQFAAFQLYGAQKQIEFPDGGFARSYDGLVGWFLPNNPTALWLLFDPLDQWPSSWFTI